MRRLLGIAAVVFVLALVVLALLSTRGPTIAERGVLVVELGGELEEAPPTDPIARFMASGPALPTLLLQLDKAAADSRIVAVLFHVRPLRVGFARVQELRDAIARLRESGKTVVAFLDLATLNATREVYLASAADRVYLSPSYLGPLAGIAGEYIHLGGLMEKIGVRFEYARVGEYKSAPEMLAERGMSAPAREVANAVLDGLFAQIVGGIASGRGLETERVRALVAEAPADAAALLEADLADGIAPRSGVLEAAGLETAEEVEVSDYQRVDPTELGLRSGPGIALVFGTGTIVQSAGRRGIRGQRFEADRVGKALRDAAESEDVRAIVLRIDSGGGSSQASDDLWQAVREVREKKPVVVSMADAAASGGYYVAAAADAIVAEPATLTGSIGVFFARPSFAGLYDKLDIGTEVLARGAFAEIGATSEPMSPEARERAEEIVHSLYDDFLGRIEEGRGMQRDLTDRLARGRVWLGASARENGLVDEMGGLWAAVQRAKREAGIEADVDPQRIVFPGSRSLRAQLRELLLGSAFVLLSEELGLADLPTGLHSWVLALDSPFAYLPPYWIDIR